MATLSSRRLWLSLWLVIPALAGGLGFVGVRAIRHAGPVIEVNDTIDLGRQDYHAVVFTAVRIRNAGRAVLRVDEFGSSCPTCLQFGRLTADGAVSDLDQLEVAPGEEAVVGVRIGVHGTPGSVLNAALRFRTNDPHRPEVSVGFTAGIRGAFVAVPDRIDLGEVEAGGRQQLVVRIYDSGWGEPYQLAPPASDSPHVRAKLLPPGAGPGTKADKALGTLVGEIEVEVSLPATPGDLDTTLLVRLVGRDQPLLRVPVVARVPARVEAVPNAAVLPRTVGGKHEYDAECAFRSNKGMSLTAEPVDVPDKVTVTPAAAPVGGPAFHIRWRADALPPPGTLETVIVRFRVSEAGGAVVVVDVPVRCRPPAK